MFIDMNQNNISKRVIVYDDIYLDGSEYEIYDALKWKKSHKYYHIYGFIYEPRFTIISELGKLGEEKPWERFNDTLR